MTDDEMRIAIAEACGHRWRNMMRDSDVKRYESEGVFPLDSLVPDYLNDLNAMHEAENHLIESSFVSKNEDARLVSKYEDALHDICVREGFIQAFWNMKARHKAEAFLRAIGKLSD